MPTATILVCDDEPALRLLVRLAIEPRGYRILDAQDGRGCLALAAKALPDLIILDMNLPDMRGTEVIAQIRDNPTLASAAILVSTGSTAPAERKAIESLGVDGILVKPFSLDSLVAHVDRLLATRAPEQIQAAPQPASPARSWRRRL